MAADRDLAAPRPTRASRRHPVVLFDLDGTLIDTIELLISAMTHAFDSREGPRPSVADWGATIGRPLVWQFGRYATSDDDLQHLVRTYRAFQYEHHDRLTRAYDGIPPLVERLHAAGHPLGVVTSKADHLANRSISHVGLAPFFDVVVGADRTTKHKPDPDPIWFALDELGDRAERAVYIGDSPFDIMAANAAGAVSIAVTWGAAAREPLLDASPRHVVDSIAELEGLLAKLGTPYHP
ncbi:MAG TPA: HAD-IA family hydrolase [Gemmatimonadaceae bacterium]|nr:HAD-IA family hydrolase [Gemmatimonadaceae bacterium]